MITGVGDLQQCSRCTHQTLALKNSVSAFSSRLCPSRRACRKYSRAVQAKARTGSCLQSSARRKDQKQCFAAKASRRAFALSISDAQDDDEDEDADVDEEDFLEDEVAGALQALVHRNCREQPCACCHLSMASGVLPGGLCGDMRERAWVCRCAEAGYQERP